MAIIPIPRSLVAAVRGIFAGTTGRVLWKLLVLVGGGLAIYYATVVTSSYFVMAIVGIIVSIALSSTVRKAVMDIWRMDFYRL